jgi:hypothetical protein
MVRGCWIVSFICTPIYMFTIPFIVSFGPKKGNLSAYSSYWYANFGAAFQLLTKKNLKENIFTYLNDSSLQRFQFTSITSRSTTYVLFYFWCFFFFFGEFLLLIMFNFNTISDLIPSHYFINTKNHMIFWLSNSSTRLGETLMFYILFLSLCSFNFLLRIEMEINYESLRTELNKDLVFAGLTFLFLFSMKAIVTTVFLYFFSQVYKMLSLRSRRR